MGASLEISKFIRSTVPIFTGILERDSIVKAKAKSSIGEALYGGTVLLLLGGLIWGVGDLFNNSVATLTGVVFFVFGVLLFLVAITKLVDRL